MATSRFVQPAAIRHIEPQPNGKTPSAHRRRSRPLVASSSSEVGVRLDDLHDYPRAPRTPRLAGAERPSWRRRDRCHRASTDARRAHAVSTLRRKLALCRRSPQVALRRRFAASLALCRRFARKLALCRRSAASSRCSRFARSRAVPTVRRKLALCRRSVAAAHWCTIGASASCAAIVADRPGAGDVLGHLPSRTCSTWMSRHWTVSLPRWARTRPRRRTRRRRDRAERPEAQVGKAQLVAVEQLLDGHASETWKRRPGRRRHVRVMLPRWREAPFAVGGEHGVRRVQGPRTSTATNSPRGGGRHEHGPWPPAEPAGGGRRRARRATTPRRPAPARMRCRAPRRRGRKRVAVMGRPRDGGAPGAVNVDGGQDTGREPRTAEARPRPALLSVATTAPSVAATPRGRRRCRASAQSRSRRAASWAEPVPSAVRTPSAPPTVTVELVGQGVDRHVLPPGDEPSTRGRGSD